MKKLLIILAFAFLPAVAGSFALHASVLAEDCMHDPIYERDWNAEITTGMRVRDIPCMESSVVLTTVPVGQVVHVIAETDGYYKIETKEGIIGWSGQWLLEPTYKSFTLNAPEEPKESLYDVVGHQFETAVMYLKNNGIIEGYSDGTFKPEQTVNRAEFTKIIIEAKLGANPTTYATGCFPDVQKTDWFAGYVCYAKQNGIIDGYSDGFFRPSNTINLAEAAKILVNTLDVEKPSVVSNIWYQVFIEAMQNKSFLPNTFSAIDQTVNRGEMAEMVWRIKENVHTQPFAQFQFQETQPSTPADPGALSSCSDANLPSSIDMSEVRDEWLVWYNSVRDQSGLHAYSYNDSLNYSATVWSEYSDSIGTMSHDRPGQSATGDYDYTLITQWFTDLGITFANQSGVTYSENVGWGTYKCSDTDCTDELLASARVIFDAFMAEKGTSYTGHYDSVMNKYFKEIGLGFSVNPEAERMYLTVHYAVELATNPGDVCE